MLVVPSLALTNILGLIVSGIPSCFCGGSPLVVCVFPFEAHKGSYHFILALPSCLPSTKYLPPISTPLAVVSLSSVIHCVIISVTSPCVLTPPICFVIYALCLPYGTQTFLLFLPPFGVFTSGFYLVPFLSHPNILSFVSLFTIVGILPFALLSTVTFP